MLQLISFSYGRTFASATAYTNCNVDELCVCSILVPAPWWLRCAIERPASAATNLRAARVPICRLAAERQRVSFTSHVTAAPTLTVIKLTLILGSFYVHSCFVVGSLNVLIMLKVATVTLMTVANNDDEDTVIYMLCQGTRAVIVFVQGRQRVCRLYGQR